MKKFFLLAIAASVFAGCGFFGEDAVDDSAATHPWLRPGREDYNIEMMPVFRNHYNMRVLHERSDAMNVLLERMERAEGIALAMGYAEGDLRRTIRFEQVTVATDTLEIIAGMNGSIEISFREGFALPEGLTLLMQDSYEISREAIKYLSEHFADILGIEPSIYDNPQYDITARILDYHFNSIEFVPNLGGELGRIIKYVPQEVILTDKVGYFPIITIDEAIIRMLNDEGSFGVEMGQPRPTEDDVVDVNLVYFGHRNARDILEYFAPWYRFGVQTTDADYLQAYLVPAIRDDYLKANPVWAIYPHQ